MNLQTHSYMILYRSLKVETTCKGECVRYYWMTKCEITYVSLLLSFNVINIVIMLFLQIIILHTYILSTNYVWFLIRCFG